MKLRVVVCIFCEWVYKADVAKAECPSCGSKACYMGYSVYGNKAYSLIRTQKYWKERKLHTFSNELNEFIAKKVCCYTYNTTEHSHSKSCPFYTASKLILGD